MPRVLGRWIVSVELVVFALLLTGLFVWVVWAQRPDPLIAELEAKIAASDSALAVAQRRVDAQAVAMDSAIVARQKAQEQTRKASVQLQSLLASNRKVLADSTSTIFVLRERLALTTATASELVATLDTLQVRIAVTDSVLAQIQQAAAFERVQAAQAIAARDSVIIAQARGCQVTGTMLPFKTLSCPSRVVSYLLGIVTLIVIL